MKVLFAVAGDISKNIIGRYRKEYQEILTYKEVYYFNAIIKELQKNKDYDRIVISEELESFASNNYDTIDKFIFEKLDSISDEASGVNGRKIDIILFCTDRRQKGNELLAKLFSIGIYNALVGDDRNYEEVCKLIKNPRTKKEAKEYYKISIESSSYRPENENEVSEVEIQNILNHFKKLGKSTEKYASSFDNIASQYTEEQLKIIVNCLPTKVKNVLGKTSEKYKKLVANSFGLGVVDTNDSDTKDSANKGLKINILENATSKNKIDKPIVIPSGVKKSKLKKSEETETEEVSSGIKVKKKPKSLEDKIEVMEKEKEEKIRKKKLKAKQEEEMKAKQAEIERLNAQKLQDDVVDDVFELMNEGKSKNSILSQKEESDVETTKEEKTDIVDEVVEISEDSETDVISKKGDKNSDIEDKDDIFEDVSEVEEDTDVEPEIEDSEEDDDIFGDLPGFEDEEESNDVEANIEDSEDDDDIFGDLPGFEDEEDTDVEPEIEDSEDDDDIFGDLPGFEDEEDTDVEPEIEDSEDDDDIFGDLPGFEDEEEANDVEANIEDSEDDDDIFGDLPGFEDEEESNDVEANIEDSEDDDDIFGDLPGFEDEEESNDVEANIEDSEDDDDIFEDVSIPGFDDEEETEENVIPDLDDDDMFDDIDIPGFEDEEESNDVDANIEDSEDDDDDIFGDIPGFEDEEESNDVEANIENNEEDNDIFGDENLDDEEESVLDFEDDSEDVDNLEIPGLDDDDLFEDGLEEQVKSDSKIEDEFEDDLFDDSDISNKDVDIPGLDDLEAEDGIEEVSEDITENNVVDDMEDDFDEDLFSDLEDTSNVSAEEKVKPEEKKSAKAGAIKPSIEYSVSNLNKLLTKEKKIVNFIGTTKNGTSFLINNLAKLFSSIGVNTAILDMTQNRNSYYIFTNNDESLRKIANSSFENLEKGYAEGIKVDKNLTVYTTIPYNGKNYTNAEAILSTLVQNHSLVLVDCDFDTDSSFFALCQELYLVQSMDILTMQPLATFLRDLQVKKILEPEKIRVVINKEIKVKDLTSKIIIGGMSYYKDPGMSVMVELFNKDLVQACSIPFEDNTYSKYLEAIVNCEISLSGYSKVFKSKLKNLADMVYPLKSKPSYSSSPVTQNYNNANKFSNNMNDTLNQMKKKY